MLKAGDRVTISENLRHDPSYPVGTSHVESVGARVIATKDGRKWSTKWGREVDGRGTKISSLSIALYKDGDDERVARQKRLTRARSLLNGHEWEVSRDLALLSDADLETLGEIAGRLKDARKAHDEQPDDGDEEG
jgi:hypothetical protein